MNSEEEAELTDLLEAIRGGALGRNQDLADESPSPAEYDLVAFEDRLAQSAVEMDKTRGELIQWSTGDGVIFVPTGEVVRTLPPGSYQVRETPALGLHFEQIPAKIEGLIAFPQTNVERVHQEIEKFWEREEVFRRYDLPYKRGILLWGPQGSGKTSAIRLLSQSVENRGGIVIVFDHPQLFVRGYRVFRQVQPRTPVVVVMEDLDAILDQWSESLILNVLDGIERVERTCFIACHEPSARLLTTDLRWVPAGEVRAGDELWALDEHCRGRTSAAGREATRRYKRAVVVSSFPARKECVRVHLDTGESFVCSTDHPWLSGVRFGKGLEWTKARDLLARPELFRPFMPWEPDRSWDAGWLAGMLDGEVRMRSPLGAVGAAELLEHVRPERLIEKFDLTGGIVQARYPARVVAVERVGASEVQSIETTAGTYFAEGFAVHNTTNHPERLGARIVNRPSRFDKRFKIGNPNAESRRLYLQSLFDDEVAREHDLDQWVRDSDGFSIAHLKELFVAVVILGDDYLEALRTLKSMRENRIGSHMDDDPGEDEAPRHFTGYA